MPYRKIPIVAGEIYHVFNRSVAKQPIFISYKDYHRTMEVIDFYRHKDLPMRFSYYNRLPIYQKQKLVKIIAESSLIVEILAFCLMPNHVHFLMKSLTDNGIIQFMSNFQNSYAKYFNTRHERTGTLFQPMFKAVRIESDYQLTHVSRYIHLNPVTAYILKTVEELKTYPWSSYPEYMGENTGFTNKDLVLGYFKNSTEYGKFVADQVDYQRKLNEIKHLILEQ